MADGGKEQLPVPVAPARGARAGVRSDVSRAKEGSYNPVGTGSAWSHNFLNQKPWHPLNFRNQVRKYEAEQKAVTDAKAREQAMAEWQAEQEKNATLAFLSPAEAQRQKDRAAISFMYTKPPGLEAALARDREAADKTRREAAAAAAAAAEAGGEAGQPGQLLVTDAAAAAGQGGKPPLPHSQQQQQQQQQQEQLRQRQQQLDRLREDPFAAILAARSALQQSEKFVLKSAAGAYGGTVPECENQLLLGDDDDEQQTAAGAEVDEAEALLASLDPKERKAVLAALEKKRKRADKAARLDQAQELLRSAGIDPHTLAAAEGGSRGGSSHKKHKKQHKRHKGEAKESSKHKKHKKSSTKRDRSRRDSGSSGSDSSQGDSSGSGRE